MKNFDLFRDKWGAENVIGYHLIPPKEEVEKCNADTETRLNGEKKNEQKVSTPGGDVSPADSEVNRGSKIEDGGLIHREDQQESENPESNEGDQVRDLQSSILDFRPDFEPDVPVALVAEPQPKVSLCMIVKNEEAHLGPCLQSAAGLFDEIVIVDTGSTDRTKKIATEFGARVVDFPWVDSFSAARNEGLRHVRGKWIMWLDADDRIDQINRQRLAELFRSLGDEKDAYSMKVRSVLDSANTSFRLLDQVRLFPSHSKVRWDYRVHEQTLPAVLRVGGRVRWTDVIIDHVGYQRITARQSKLERNLRLLELDNTDRPDDPFTLFNLGWTLLDLGKTEEALPRLKRSLEKSSPDSSIARKLYHLITLTHRQLGQKGQALVICREGLQKFPDDTELLVEEGLMLLDNREFIPAETNLLQLVETKPGPYFGSVDDGMRGYRTRDVLARHYRDQGRLSEAEVQWRTAVAERSSFIPGWLGLGELFLRQGRRSDLERLTKSLDSEPGGDVEAAILRARAHREREEFPAARRILEDLIPRVPQAEGPRVLLSHVLLQEGKDLTAAEDVLRQILELNPRNAEARHNLMVLLGKQGRTLEREEEPTHRLATAAVPG
jgi:tetratricopeptide (TPR) repeat protein